jgi:hypothetical protein
VFCRPCSDLAGEYTRCAKVSADYPELLIGATVADGQCEPSGKPGDPAEPRLGLGMLANQIARQWHAQPANRYPITPWAECTAEQRDFWMTLGSTLFTTGKRCGDEAAMLELTHQAATWEAFAEQAERQGRAHEGSQTGDRWDGRTAAYGNVATELRTRIAELTGQRTPRHRPGQPRLTYEAVEQARVDTVAVDFDGVIHAYTQGWQDGTIYDPPVPGALDSLHHLMDTYAVFIHTTREPHQVADWLNQRGIPATPLTPPGAFWNERGRVLVTNRKLGAVAYIDDRAIRFQSWVQVLAELATEVNP